MERALALEQRLRGDSLLAQQACEKALALRESLRQAAEVLVDRFNFNFLILIFATPVESRSSKAQ